MDNLPRVLIISTVCGKATEIAQKIGKEQISRHSHEDDIDYYLWNINNKYYTSQILLCATENPHINIPTEGIQALILYHDPQADNAEQNLDQWSSLISSLSEADVLLFTCNAISNVDVKDKIITWCINKKFELVELLESDSTENLQYDSEHNTYGIERIIEALHAHIWPNILLKGKPSNVDEKESNLDQVTNKIENIQLTHNPTEYPNGATIFDAMMDDEDTHFSDLFVHLMTMKEHAASLPTNERRLTAEKLVTAFWKLMGEDSEIYD
ncbi:PREDICTED: alpha- and gamma-adaptin-binding protein p34-like [Polistes dominula]|uniref:Alpha- and gamma-adaptin-binding protein p34-like n=1 Tax=Polistes dominula TaxID=743375 RepID=A0ABM1HXT5_POLDO|nr:PREDICTED: alpha- and gamma-adaptin-binding protein p34-like [Polistes dominula]